MLAALLTASCDSRVAPMGLPRPAGAESAEVPGDVSAERLGLVLDEIGYELRARFGPLNATPYRLPVTSDWETIERFYDEALTPALSRTPGVYRQGRRHRLAVWSATESDGPAVAVALIDTAERGGSAAHRILLVLQSVE
jgi:hypothetical protein